MNRRQAEKGIRKYGTEIDPLDTRFDWLDMAIEEQVDGFNYLVAEQRKRNHIVGKLRRLTSGVPDDIRSEIDHWLDALEGK